MSEVKRDKPRKTHIGIIGHSLFTLLKILLVSILAYLFQLFWFIGQVFYQNPASAVNSAQAVAQNELQFIQQNPTPSAKFLLNLFEVIHAAAMPFFQFLNRWNLGPLQSALNLLSAVSEIQLARLFIFILALPLFIVSLVVLITDGLVKRDIRKFQGARESAFTFHRLKSCLGFCFFIPFFIYLSMPLSVSPILILIPHILLFSGIAALSITHFKKHL
jgi:hypothetical protein